MRDRLLTIIPVTLIAALIWLFAEAESLGTFSGERTLVRVQPREGRDREIRMTEGGRTSVAVNLDLRAPQAMIGQIRSILAQGIELRPGTAGVPSSAGVHEIDLAQALRATQSLSGQGIDVTDVRPRTVEVQIIDFETRDLPIANPRLDGVDVDGPVRITPQAIPVRLPSSVWSSLDPNVALVAEPTPTDLTGLPTSGAVQLNVPIRLPEELASLSNPPVLTQRASLEFTIRNRSESADFQAVPVQVLLSSIDQRDWDVTIHPDDVVVSLRVEGPAAEVALMKTASRSIIAVLSLSSEELEQGIASKSISFHQRSELLLEIPDSVRITPSKDRVRFTSTRRLP